MQKAAGKLKGERQRPRLGVPSGKLKGPVPLWKNERVADPRRKTQPMIGALQDGLNEYRIYIYIYI